MFVVKRPFKNFGKVLTVGSVIAEPTSIKRFKGRVAEGKIIEVTEQTYKATSEYFLNKHGVVIPPLTESAKTATNKVTDKVTSKTTDGVKASTKKKAVAKANVSSTE